ncbi:hypothetical protein [Kitasatospora sp. NPDC004289]
MTAQSYEEFRSSYARTYGEDQALAQCPPFMRRVAAGLRQMAATEPDPENVAALTRRADRMDPDLRQEVPGAAA